MKKPLLAALAIGFLWVTSANAAPPIRQEKPTVIAAELGFPSGIGGIGLHNITPRFAIGGALNSALLWSSIGALGRYYFDDEPETTFLELRLNANPFSDPSTYIALPHLGTHALYGWESRHADGHYSHAAVGFGVTTTGNPNILLGFFNLEFAIGRAF